MKSQIEGRRGWGHRQRGMVSFTWNRQGRVGFVEGDLHSLFYLITIVYFLIEQYQLTIMELEGETVTLTIPKPRSQSILFPDHSPDIQHLVALVQELIARVELTSKSNFDPDSSPTPTQISTLLSFKTHALHQYFLTLEDEPQMTCQTFYKQRNISKKKMVKFQKNLLLYVEEFLQTVKAVSACTLALSKNLLINILDTLKNVSNHTLETQIINHNIQPGWQGDNSSEDGKELGEENSHKHIKEVVRAIQGIARQFSIQVKRAGQALRRYSLYCDLAQQDRSEEEKMIRVDSMIRSQLNLLLADYIQQKCNSEKTVMYTCLSCEAKISFEAMGAHLELCQSKTDIEQRIINLDGEIGAKVYDLIPELATARNILREKLKQLNQQIKQELDLKNGKFKKVKAFYGAPLLSKTLGDISESDSDEGSSTETKKVVGKSVKDLSIKQLSIYITIIEELQSIGNKIKNQRSAASLGLSNEIYNIKNILLHKFNRLQIQCPIVNSLLNLLAMRRDSMRKLSKSFSQAKSSGLKFVEDIMFQNQYQDIADSTRKNKKKKRFLTPYQLYFSEEETPSVSNEAESKVCLNDFLVLGFLGKGQFGEILLVKKKQTGVKYAMKKVMIKEIKKQSENIENQLMALSIVSSEFVVKTIFSFTENDFHYFVMEYMPNGDFFQLLQHENRLYEAEAKLYLAEIATAINDLHKSGIIHRDIKPQNILISQSGHIKISDFGLSESGSLRKLKQEEKKKRMTQFVQKELSGKESSMEKKGNKIVGSPYFMSPEVLSGEAASVMSDWWSFGVLVFEVLTGIPPFVGEGFDEIVSKIFEGKIWSQSIRFGSEEDEISYRAKDLIEKLLVRNQDKRLGLDFQQIKRHAFFEGINWEKLTDSKPYFQFQNEADDLGEGKEISSKASSFRSTNPDLKLIRKDILIEETRSIYSRKNKEAMRMKSLIQTLRKSTI